MTEKRKEDNENWTGEKEKDAPIKKNERIYKTAHHPSSLFNTI
jgi:hypothetical protein